MSDNLSKENLDKDSEYLKSIADSIGDHFKCVGVIIIVAKNDNENSAIVSSISGSWHACVGAVEEYRERSRKHMVSDL